MRRSEVRGHTIVMHHAGTQSSRATGESIVSIPRPKINTLGMIPEQRTAVLPQHEMLGKQTSCFYERH